MFLTCPGGEAAEQHEGRGDQSSERQNDQDGEHHTCTGALTLPAPSADLHSVQPLFDPRPFSYLFPGR